MELGEFDSEATCLLVSPRTMTKQTFSQESCDRIPAQNSFFTDPLEFSPFGMQKTERGLESFSFRQKTTHAHKAVCGTPIPSWDLSQT